MCNTSNVLDSTHKVLSKKLAIEWLQNVPV